MSEQTIFMTGAGGFIGRYILRHYLERTDCSLYLLEHGRFCERLRTFVAKNVHDPDRMSRIRILEGDIALPGLGLDPHLIGQLQSSVTRALHMAAVYDLTVPKELAFRINVDGTRNVLEFLEPAKQLELLGHTSTCAVSGNYEGAFTEDDFDVGQTFKNHYEETKYIAEKYVREYRDRIPTVIFRPSYVMGDSKTGELDKLDGPYFGLVMISRFMHTVVPDCGKSKCNAPPVDYVSNAMYTLFEENDSAGKVFQLADPAPLTFNEYLDLACEYWPRYKPLLRIPPWVIAPLFRIPGFASLLGIPHDVFRYVFLEVDYDVSQAQEALSKHGITCPPLPEHIGVLIRYYQEHCRDMGVRRGRIYRDFSR